MLLHTGKSSTASSFNLKLECFYQYSLYISLVQLCLLFFKVTPENARNLNIPLESVNKTPSGDTFVKSNLQKVCFWLNLLFHFFLLDLMPISFTC
jgi:hypothetical protein